MRATFDSLTNLRLIVLSVCTLAAAASVRVRAADKVAPPTNAEQSAARAAIHEKALRAHIRLLADDLLEGRGPGSRGDALARSYIRARFQALGLQPAAPGGGWYQPVPLVGVTTHAPPTLTLRQGDKKLTLKKTKDYVLTSGKPKPQAGFKDAEIVFVGYGIEAPEYQWNDYKDVDVRGKVVLIMNNDPSDDPELFAGRRRLVYGRWDYKYAMAARKGAAGAIIIHTTESAGYPYQVVQTSWAGEEFELRGVDVPRMEVRAWFTEDAAQRTAKLAGRDLAKLQAAAQSRDFRPVPLGVKLSASLRCSVRSQKTANVLGLLPGSDPQRSREMVIFMAHHDHIGMAAQRNADGDQIYNGAVDNASGVAALLTVAEAFTRLKSRPKRSILFAAVGAEEQGLLGSAYLAANPPTQAGNLAAVLNMDGVNIIGPTRDVNFIGYGKSSLDRTVKAIASWQKRVVTPDQFPDRGYYYRSDQFSLAKIGVPGVYLHSGIHVIGKPDGYGKKKLDEWTRTRYHQPSDEYDESWDLRGAVADIRLLFYTGLRTAQQSSLPSWKPGDEFEAARKRALRAREKLRE